MYRSATYDFLLTFHIATMGLSRTVSEINDDLSRKSQNLTTPVYSAPLLKGLALELGTGDRGRKTKMMWLPGRERRSAVYIQCTNVTDRQTPGDSKNRAYQGWNKL